MTKEELLNEINPCLQLNNKFLLKIYGYELSFPGFKEEALKKLEDAGFTHVRKNYEALEKTEKIHWHNLAIKVKVT